MSILINPKSVNPRRTKNQSGFTIIEILVVVLMVGIVGAIAAPTWIMFANRQKVRTVNDRVFNAIQEAQSKAQLTSLSHFIQFGEHRGIPAYRIYLTTTKDNQRPDWQTLDVNGEINEGQITLRVVAPGGDNILEFDHLGVVLNTIKEDDPFWVVVSSADNSVTHCVAVRTRLLSTQKLQGDDCNP
ncbi:type II secretion system protein [Limnospira platensis]|uniref:type II secretion system protein n=1 Tax=Limnospira platensis TaxID=118562 RepID=UPI000280466F|nr:PHA accumulation regulator DNA-binding-like protein [Arthrospira platensis C1]UWU48564.1 prepilin-type N-terminal cleavage/methylation domain-containing protein [Arthrospira platensis C1]